MNSQQPRTASLFKNGKNQALRLPMEFTLDADEVFIEQKGGQLIITPKPKSWQEYFESDTCLSSDFPDQIDELPLQDRQGL